MITISTYHTDESESCPVHVHMHKVCMNSHRDASIHTYSYIILQPSRIWPWCGDDHGRAFKAGEVSRTRARVVLEYRASTPTNCSRLWPSSAQAASTTWPAPENRPSKQCLSPAQALGSYSTCSLISASTSAANRVSQYSSS